MGIAVQQDGFFKIYFKNHFFCRSVLLIHQRILQLSCQVLPTDAECCVSLFLGVSGGLKIKGFEKTAILALVLG